MAVLLNIVWYLVIVATILAIGISIICIVSQEARTIIYDGISQGISTMNSKDQKDWEEFQKLPLHWKFIVTPYFAAFVVLLLLIIRKSKNLFTNFRNDIVFNDSNVVIIANINKLLIVFAVITFNFSTLLVCVLLVLLSQIFKNGAALQEEHDLTV